MIEPQVERKEVGFAEPREHAGLEERTLAEARLAEEHGERLPAHEADEFLGLLFPPEEEPAEILGECGEPRPRRLAGDQRGGLPIGDCRLPIGIQDKKRVSVLPGWIISAAATRRSGRRP